MKSELCSEDGTVTATLQNVLPWHVEAMGFVSGPLTLEEPHDRDMGLQQPKESVIRSLGFILKTRYSDGSMRHYVGAIKIAAVKKELQMQSGDQLIVLNYTVLLGMSHEEVVKLFLDLKARLMLVFERPAGRSDQQNHYTFVVATLHFGSEEGDNTLDVDEIDGISSNSEDFIPLPPKRGVILKSLGDPTKFLRGRQDRIYMGNDSTNPQDYQIDLIPYVYLPLRCIVVLITYKSRVFLEVTDAGHIQSKVDTVTLGNPPRNMLFQCHTRDSHVVSFEAVIRPGHHLAIGGPQGLHLIEDTADLASMFDIYKPSEHSSRTRGFSEARPRGRRSAELFISTSARLCSVSTGKRTSCNNRYTSL